MANPGGVTEVFLSKSQMGGFYYFDIFFLLSFAVVFFGPFNANLFFKNKTARGIFLVMLFFVFYKIIVWGLIVPEVSFSDFVRYTLIRERSTIFGFFYFIPVYLFARRDIKSFLSIIIIFNSIIVLATLLTIVFGLDLMQVDQFERYHGSNTLRYLIRSYNFLLLLIPCALTIIIGKIRVKYFNILVLGGCLVVIIIIISITKGLYISAVGMIVSATWMTIKLLKIRVHKSFFRIAIAAGLLIFSLGLLFPKYLEYSQKAFQDIFMLATEGETTEGETSRYWQIPAFMHEISQHPFLGTGHGYDQLSKEFDINQFDATDFPLLAGMMQYGAIGISIYLIYYLRLFQIIKGILKKLASLGRAKILRFYKYEFIFSIMSIAYMVGYFLRFYQIFSELINGVELIIMSINTGILIACFERINIKSQVEYSSQLKVSD